MIFFPSCLINNGVQLESSGSISTSNIQACIPLTYWICKLIGKVISRTITFIDLIMKLQKCEDTYRKCQRISENLEEFLLVIKFRKIEQHADCIQIGKRCSQLLVLRHKKKNEILERGRSSKIGETGKISECKYQNKSKVMSRHRYSLL